MPQGTISRNVFPANFSEQLSDQLLVAPETQYLFADLLIASQNNDLISSSGEFGLPFHKIQSAGKDWVEHDRDALILASPLGKDLIATPMLNFTGGPGHTMKFNRPVWTDTTYTMASRQLPTGITISTEPSRIDSEQIPLSLARIGGPFNSATGLVGPYAMEAYDAQMGIHKAQDIIGKHLRRDYHRLLEVLVITIANQPSAIAYAGTGVTSNDGLGAADANPFTLATLRAASLLADEADLPAFADGHRVAVLTPLQVSQLQSDSLYKDQSQNFSQYNILFAGMYVGTVHNTHIFKSNMLAKPINASSAAVQEGMMLFPGFLLAGTGRSARVEQNTNTNYGETGLFIWLADLALGLSDNRFVIGLRSN